MTLTEASWQEDNRLHLAAVLDDVLIRVAGDLSPSNGRTGCPGPDAAAIQASMTADPALVRLVALFGLDRFGSEVVAWCAGYELDPRYGDAAGPPTVGRALERLSAPSWRALHPMSPLRRWGLVEIESEAPFVSARLRLAGDVLQYLLGLPPGSGPRRLLVSAGPAVAAPLSLRDLATEIVSALARNGPGCALGPAAGEAAAGRGPAGDAPAAGDGPAGRSVVALHGATRAERRLVAQLCAGALEADLVRLDLRDVPAEGSALDQVLTDANRLARLAASVLLVEAPGGGDRSDDGPPGGASSDDGRLRRAVAVVEGTLFVSSPAPMPIDPSRHVIRREVLHPDPEERLALWHPASGRPEPARGPDPTSATAPRPWLSEVAFQYRLDSPTIAAVSADAVRVVSFGPGAGTLAGGPPTPDDGEETEVRAGCRRHARMRLDRVAQRVAIADDIEVVVPALQREQLDELEAHVRLSYQVTTGWGMGGTRAPGVAALFAGPSGTGKTLAASALARRTGLDLYRVDLATVMSKYIGETEKNLQRIFDAAETGGAILLFDEADALFGKRSEVKDSHDRYANISTAYLLQKMERAVTPTVLTTNTKAAIDPAFARRLRFVVDFPFPDREARQEIWSRVYPTGTPTREIDPARLASLAVNGATIHRIALRAAFLAARDGGAVSMPHLVEASRRELRQAGRTLRPEEVAEWA